MRLHLHPKRWSLATKWSLMLTALALGPLMLVIRFNYEAASSKILEQSIRGLSNGAADTAASLDDAIGERVRQARYLASVPEVKDFVTTPIGMRGSRLGDLQAQLKATQAAYPYLESLDVIDGQGVVLYSTSGIQGFTRDSELMRTVSTGQIYVAGLQTMKGKTTQSLVIAAPIGNGGVLRMQSSPQFLKARVAHDDHREGTGTLGILFDETGHVIAWSDGAAPPADLTLQPGGKLALPGGKTYHAQTDRLESINWTYVMALPEAQVAAELQAQRTRSLVLALGIAAIMGGLARLLALSFTKPLMHIAEATRALADGDLTFQFQPVSSEDEVGQLQQGFQEAYKQLRRLVARMRLSSHLVAEASAHLHTMTAEGGQASSTVTASTEKLSTVAADLERQVAHFQI